MTSRIALTLDNQPVEIERGVFPDGAVWLKVIGELPRFTLRSCGFALPPCAI